MTPDVNVLVAAARAGHPHHRVALEWLDDARVRATPERRLVILPMVANGYLRVVQLRKVFPEPMPAESAMRFMRVLLSSDNVLMPRVGPEWPVFEDLFREHEPTGGSVTDAWIAAAVLHLGEHFVTFDRGFQRLLPPEQLTLLSPSAS